MACQITCPSCEKVFSAPESWLGEFVQCPRCSEPFQAEAPPDATPSEEPVDAWEDDEEYELQSEDQPAPPAAETTAQPRATACPQCGAPLLEDGLYCQHCRYHLGLKRELGGDVEIDAPSERTGVSRWLDEQLDESTSPTEVRIWMWIFLVVILLIVSLVLHPWGYAITVPLLLIAIVLQWYWLRRPAAATSIEARGALANFLWNSVLKYHRTTGWRNAGNFRRLQTVSLKDHDFGDEDLPTLADRDSLEVLDAEDTQLSDNSVPVICGMKELQYLVIRGTKISLDGAERIQKRLPSVWIWW